MTRIRNFLLWVTLKITEGLLFFFLFELWLWIVVIPLYVANAQAMSDYVDENIWLYGSSAILLLLVYPPVAFVHGRIMREMRQARVTNWMEIFSWARLYLVQPWWWFHRWRIGYDETVLRMSAYISWLLYKADMKENGEPIKKPAGISLPLWSAYLWFLKAFKCQKIKIYGEQYRLERKEYWRKRYEMANAYFGNTRQEPTPNKRKADPYSIACKLLGLTEHFSKASLVAAYRKAMQTAHPDIGGSHRRAQMVNAARAVILRRRGW